MEYTEEQKRRIAANKAEALRRRQALQQAQARPALPAPPASSTSAPRPSSFFQQPGSSASRPSTSGLPRPPGAFNRPAFAPRSFPNQSNPRNPNFYRNPTPGVYQKPSFTKPGQSFQSFYQQKPAKTSFNNVSLSIYDTERFKLDMKPLLDPILKIAQSLPDRFYDGEKKCWAFPWKRYEEVKAAVKSIKDVDFNLEELLPSVVEYFKKKKAPTEPDEDQLANLKVTMWSALYDYQQAGILFGIANNGRIMIADEMGLGKSAQALGLAFYYRTEWPLLIVTPSSVKGAWSGEIERLLPDMCQVTTIEKTSDMIPTSRTTRTIVIVSYDMMSRKQDVLLKNTFYVIIFDESHMLKEEKAKRTKLATKLAHAASRVILLSGTPAISRPAELYTQIRMITPNLFPKFYDFAVMYCDGKETVKGFIARGALKTEELTTILNKAIMIRRTKENIVLPTKTRHFIYLSEKNINIQSKTLRDAKEKATKTSTDRTVKPNERHESMMEYYRATALAKSSAVSSYLENEYIKPGFKRKMLIFAHHQVVLDSISALLTSSKIGYIRIDGATKDRTTLVEEFQTDENCKVAVLSMTAAGVGITLTAASLVIFAELHWTPATLMQAEDRAHRVGQTRPVDIHYLIAPKTVDDDMLTLIKAKMKVLTSVALNTGTLDNSKKQYEEPNASKITAWFQKLSEKENVDTKDIKKGGCFDPDEVITLDDDWDDDIFIDEFPSPEKKKENSNSDFSIEESPPQPMKRQSSDDNDIPTKRQK